MTYDDRAERMWIENNLGLHIANRPPAWHTPSSSSDHWEQLYVEAWDQARHSEAALLRFKGRPYHAFAPRIAAVADALVFWRRCERSLEHLGEGSW